MRIVLLKSHFNSIGGLEKYTLKMASVFASRGCAVTILTTDSGQPFPSVPAKIVTLGKRSKLSFYHLLHFDYLCRKWLKQNPAEFVFGTERNRFQTHYRPGSGVHAFFLKQRRLTDTLLKRASFACNPLHLSLLKMERATFEDSKLKKIFPNSEMVKKEILEYFAVSEKKMEVIHNGVEWEDYAIPFEEGVEKEFFQKKIGLTSGRHTFLFIGNGYNRKGLLFLLKGFSLLKKENVHLLIVGKEKNISYYQKFSADLGLREKVSFFGRVANPLPFYQAADTLVLPTIYDPFANVTLEALAMGLYVVTSAFNGGKEILNEKTGTVIENLTSAESVKKSLESALLHPKLAESAIKMRNSIKTLDFTTQLNKIVEATINTISEM